MNKNGSCFHEIIKNNYPDKFPLAANFVELRTLIS